MRRFTRLERRLDALAGAEHVLQFDVRTGVPRHDDPSGVVRGLTAIGRWLWRSSREQWQ
jgi:hypothetical protein